MFIHTGDYAEHPNNDILHSTYYTFTPRPLMDGGFYSMSDELAASLTDAHRALGILEGMASLLPNMETLSSLLLFREGCFSKMIDYPDTDILSKLIMRTSGIPDDLNNIITAYRYAIDATTPDLRFNSIAGHAIYAENSQQKVHERTKQIFLRQSTSNFRQYNPTAPENIRAALIDIQKYMESGVSDVLVRAAMCHYQFEMVHPYENYNGIVGRILSYHILSQVKLHGIRLLSLSASLYQHKAEYFNKLATTQKSGNYIGWIDFFIRAIHEAAQSAIRFIHHYEALTRSDEDKILSRPKGRADHTPDVYRYFKSNLASGVRQAGEGLKLSFDTVSRSVGILCDMGILHQTSQGARNRVFCYADIVKYLISAE